MGINKWFIDMLGMIGISFYFAILFKSSRFKKEEKSELVYILIDRQILYMK